jgi:acyl-CoA synthetase
VTARLLSLQDVSTARRYHAAGWWRADTFFDLLVHWAARKPGAAALSDSATTLTYAEALDWTEGLARRLAEAGLRPGDRVAVWSPSRIESAITLLACSRMGLVCVPSLHRDHTPDGVIEILGRTRAAALVVQKGWGMDTSDRDVAGEAASLDHMRIVIELEPLTSDTKSDCPRFGGMVEFGGACPTAPADDPDRVFYIAFTSGTTGRPKGVMHSNNTLLSNGRAVAADLGFDEDTVVYTLSPMSHNMGTVSLAVTLACGGSLVMHGPLDAARAVERIIETGASYLVGVPTHGIDLLASLGERRSFGRVTHFQLAGSTVPRRLAQSYTDLGIVVQNCYGMTENCSFLYTRPGDVIDVVIGSCGRCAEGMEIAIVDPDDPETILSDGNAGEVAIRGPSMMLGYFDDQIATETSYTRSGWFLSGDLGIRDDAGNVTIVGRKKDLIIRGGRNLHPAALEEAAMKLPCVAKAAAFGVPDERLGERICLAVIPAAPVGEQDLVEALDANGLPTAYRPEFVVILDAFPLTASGKILKRELVRLAATGELRPTSIAMRPRTAQRPTP